MAVDHPHLTHSQRDRLTGTPPWEWGEIAKRLAISGKAGNQILGRGGEAGDLHVEEEGNI